MNRMSWAAYAAMFTVIGALVLALVVDWKIRSDDQMENDNAMQANDQRVAQLEERVAFLERTAVLQPTEEYNPQLLKAFDPYEPMSNRAPSKEEVRDSWVNRVWLANTPNQVRNFYFPTNAINRQPHNAMRVKDRVIACAMRIHTMEQEQEQDMLRLRVDDLEERHEALEEMVYGFHPTNKAVKGANKLICVYHNWTGDEDD